MKRNRLLLACQVLYRGIFIWKETGWMVLYSPLKFQYTSNNLPLSSIYGTKLKTKPTLKVYHCESFSYQKYKNVTRLQEDERWIEYSDHCQVGLLYWFILLPWLWIRWIICIIWGMIFEICCSEVKKLYHWWLWCNSK